MSTKHQREIKETAVEWLIEKLDKIYHIKEKFLPSDWEFLEETSKKIEKEQIMDAWIEGGEYGYLSQESDRVLAEQYYNETFNINEK
jgi:hypothetical protein